MDEIKRIIFLETYFKGDFEDLTGGEYKQLIATTKEIFSNPMAYDWSEPAELEKVDEDGLG